jgi:23S rRNA pseudouridine2605 synthase
MIAEGRIALHGDVLTTPATLLDDLNGVTVDGKAVAPPAAARLWRFYKPAGCLTAAFDPKGRPTIYDRLPGGLPEGVEIEGIRYGSIDANLERRTGRNCWIELALTEGKNREVRRVLAYLGLQVSRLIRTSYGPFTMEELDPGQVGEVQREDLFRFRQTLK